MANGLSVQGTVSDGNGPVGAGVPVVFSRIGPRGEVLSTLGAGVTDASGHYQILVAELSSPTTTVAAEVALTGAPRQHAFLASTTQDIGPVEEGVYELIQDVVAAPSVRSVSDFSADEVSALEVAGATALQTAGTDLQDAAAVKQELIAQVGGQLAQAAGGTVQFPAEPTFTDPPDLQGVPAGSPYTDGAGNPYWIRNDGELYDGNSDNGQWFAVSGSGFPNQPAVSEDGRELVFGPVTSLGSSGVNVVRKAYVSPDSGFVRYAEELSNDNDADITVPVELYSYLDSPQLVTTANGDSTLDASDAWLIAGPSSGVNVGLLAPGIPFAFLNQGYDALWSVTVPAHGLLTILHWELVGQHGPEDVAKRLRRIGGYAPPELFAGLSNAEIADRANAPFATIVGEAGTVAPLGQITVTNVTTSQQEIVLAADDGSFRSGIAYSSGDQIEVSGTNGTATRTVTAP